MKKGISIFILLSLISGMLYIQGNIAGVWKSLVSVTSDVPPSKDHNQHPIFSEACSGNEVSDEKQAITLIPDLYPSAVFLYAYIKYSRFNEFPPLNIQVPSTRPVFLINRSILV